ncbi:MAG: mannose-1-phosphate guanylyltransferase [Planctomycetes bacterium]|jgi:mannose-1-phosphate guanylyltransferase|nr:mannose-1-phosphate guanylyltransferase [Planctomycetota bacterium]
MMNPHLYCVIMAGGSGTRFWPASRRDRPKQFLPISGRLPMIAETQARLEGLVPIERVLVVTAESQVDLVLQAIPTLPRKNVLAEPAARNTAPCIGFAAFETLRRDREAIQVVLPSDHVIAPVEEFQSTIEDGVAEAQCGETLVTFGIRPDHPATGYGYIEVGPRTCHHGGSEVFSVQAFVEKPSRKEAEGFLSSGNFLWNSGMFVWKAKAIENALREHLPEIPVAFERYSSGAPLDEVYSNLPALPIDTGVMERASNVRVLPIEYSWSDVGSWAALPELHPADESGNHPVLSEGGLLVTEDSRGCLAYAEEDEVIALIGVENLIVVRAGNATLVCPRNRAQDVRRIVDRLEREGKHFL